MNVGISSVLSISQSASICPYPIFTELLPELLQPPPLSQSLSNQRSLDELGKELSDLKKKYNICAICDRKAAKEKYIGIQFCAKHLKQNIKLNQNLGPMINEVMSAFVGVLSETKKNNQAKTNQIV